MRAIGKLDICETEEFKTAMKLTSFLSKEDILLCINEMITAVKNCQSAPEDIVFSLKQYCDKLKNASDTLLIVEKSAEVDEKQKSTTANIKARSQWNAVRSFFLLTLMK